VQVADARARAEAATLLAESEVERAKGVAEANRIIADSITPEYTTWLYVDQLDEVIANGGQIIYIPTEAGIPILEAGGR
jgi:regulator of protease activity HflC (stomatin/prohibitin superfamily)